MGARGGRRQGDAERDAAGPDTAVKCGGWGGRRRERHLAYAGPGYCYTAEAYSWADGDAALLQSFASEAQQMAPLGRCEPAAMICSARFILRRALLLSVTAPGQR